MNALVVSMFTPVAKAMAEKLGLQMGRANFEEFAAELQMFAEAERHIVDSSTKPA